MERGLIWLPLLALFFGLAWAGWNEFRKVEAYRSWAQNFDRAKYDIRAVLGQKGDRLTWGKPTRQGMVDLQAFSLRDVTDLRVLANGEPIAEDRPPQRDEVSLRFELGDDARVNVPFTDAELAVQWAQVLRSLDPATGIPRDRSTASSTEPSPPENVR